MATIIDALVVTLGLDSSGFKKGEKEAADAQKRFVRESEVSAKQIAAQAKVMTEGFRRVRNELLGLFAVAIGANGLKDFIANSVKGQAQLGYLSKNLGMSARQLDAWGKVARTVGGTAQDFQQGFQNMAAGIEEFKLTGNSNVVAMFKQLGVNIQDASGKLKGYDQLLMEVADADKFKKGTPQDQLFIFNQLGLGEPMLKLARKGGQAVHDSFQEMYRLSHVTDESTKAAQEAQKNWGLFTDELQAVGDSIFNSTSPALVQATEDLRDLGKWINDHHAEIEKFFSDMVKGSEDFASSIRSIAGGNLGDNLGTLATSISALAGALALLAAKGGGGLGVLGRLGLLGGSYYGGHKIGEQINKHIEGTPVGDLIGSTVTHVWAALGSKDAQASVDAMNRYEGDQKLEALEKKYQLPPGLLDSVWNVESARGKNMVSSAGAKGHFQFMDATAKQYGVGNPFNFDQSAEGAARMYRDLLDANGGDLDRALAAYNWGQGNLSRKGLDAAPGETVDYIRKVKAGMGYTPRPSAQQFAAMSPAEQAAFEQDRLAAQQADMQYGVRPGELRIGAAAALPAQPSTTTTNTSETHIGALNVYTQATDGAGVGRDLREDLNNNALITLHATGMR